jgi:hypothetical protein
VHLYRQVSGLCRHSKPGYQLEMLNLLTMIECDFRVSVLASHPNIHLYTWAYSILYCQQQGYQRECRRTFSTSTVLAVVEEVDE